MTEPASGIALTALASLWSYCMAAWAMAATGSALIESGYRAIVIDSRGHGRSTRDERPYSYELMASDLLAVMNALHLDRAVLVGWSDGACTALILAEKHPARAAGVCFFACNMDPTPRSPLSLRRR